MRALPIHFFTIVFNGEPFIRMHYDQMARLTHMGIPWHWHIVEGVAELTHDASWSKWNGGYIPLTPPDATTEYLNEIGKLDTVTVYQRAGNWDGKLEMVNAPLHNLPDECLLWQVDADEVWTAAQFVLMYAMFTAQPERTAASFHCRYYVGRSLVADDMLAWRRVWRYRSGDAWCSHEPPVLARKRGAGAWDDLMALRPFSLQETQAAGLVFDHYSYVTKSQVAFKEAYYGYKGITKQWEAMQTAKPPFPLMRYFNWPWAHPSVMVRGIN